MRLGTTVVPYVYYVLAKLHVHRITTVITLHITIHKTFSHTTYR